MQAVKGGLLCAEILLGRLFMMETYLTLGDCLIVLSAM